MKVSARGRYARGFPHSCPFKKVWQNVTEAASEVLDNTDFEHLCAQFTDGPDMYFI